MDISEDAGQGSLYFNPDASFSKATEIPASDTSKQRQKRAVSLSPDWENVLTGAGGKKIRVSRKATDQIITEHPGFNQFERETVKLCTNSQYTGNWDSLGMAGFGSYDMPHGVNYEGTLKDGMFHGEGTLTWPLGCKMDGVWVNGKLTNWRFRFADGLEYNQTNWKYCIMPDRRFYECMQTGLRPAGRTLKTQDQPTRAIPDDCYDTCDGFYNPKTKCVMSAYDPLNILSVPIKVEEEWIINNYRLYYRKAWDEPTGYRPDLYEKWTNGASDRKMSFSSSSNSLDETDYSQCVEEEKPKVPLEVLHDVVTQVVGNSKERSKIKIEEEKLVPVTTEHRTSSHSTNILKRFNFTPI